MSFTIPDNDEAFNNNQSIWMQTDINALIAALRGDGVISGCVVSEDGGGASMDLDITSGTIQINDTVYSITGSAAAVTIGAADGSNPRIDLICANTSLALTVTAGTPAANPKAPDIPANSVLLAMIYVPASDTTIADNQITDKRVIVREVAATTQKDIQTHTVLHSETLSGTGRFDVSSIDQTYDHLLVRMVARGDVAAVTIDTIKMFLNNDTTEANYYRGQLYNYGGAAAADGNDATIGVIPAADAPANSFGIAEIFIANYTSTDHSKSCVAKTDSLDRLSAARTYTALFTVTWNNTAAINRITLQPDGYAADEFVADSYIEIVGIKEETVLIVS